jgi:hypothetical protein
MRHALGAADPTITRHLEGCPVCKAEVAQIQKAAGSLPTVRSLERRTETPECLEEPLIADFVEGRLSPETRAPLVAHLLTCARCRSVVAATGRLLADETVAREIPRTRNRRWLRWSLPVGLAAAAVLLLVWPRSDADIDLREPTPTDTVALLPIGPRASVARVDRFIWSSMPDVDRYRLRLYDDEGGLLWTAESTDTTVSLPDSVRLSPRAAYSWKVEAQTDWQRWTASPLVDFRVEGLKP